MKRKNKKKKTKTKKKGNEGGPWRAGIAGRRKQRVEGMCQNRGKE